MIESLEQLQAEMDKGQQFEILHENTGDWNMRDIKEYIFRDVIKFIKKERLRVKQVKRLDANDSLLMQCARKIRRWPRLNALWFPDLPKGCHFVISGLGGYKIEIKGHIFTKEDVNKIKKLDRAGK